MALAFFLALGPQSGTAEGANPGNVKLAFGRDNGARREQDALARNRYQESLKHRYPSREAARTTLQQAPVRNADMGSVAVVENDGTLVTQPRTFDLTGTSFRFVPESSAAYHVESRSTILDSGSGTQMNLADDDTQAVALPFSFPFFGKTYTSVWVNSDGNLTFGESDTSTSARDLGRFAWGPPRIGPLFADLDPGTGRMFYRHDADGTLIVWENVPEYGPIGANSFSVKLFPDGGIEFVYGSRVDCRDAIVGISPGSTNAGITAVDYSAGLPTGRLTEAIVEVFSRLPQLSETAIARKFFQTHGDDFDQLVVFLAFPFDLGGAFSYELNVSNDVLGIGNVRVAGAPPVFDDSGDYGSSGRLKSFVLMGALEKFDTNTSALIVRTYNSLQVIAHEVAHRWLSFPLLRESGFNTLSLLDRDDSGDYGGHWSFFFNADGSLMEGNQIRDYGPGSGTLRFATTSQVTNRLSDLDLYLMGFKAPEGVGPMFYVQNPTNTNRTPQSVPSFLSTSFGGTRVDFTIDDVIAANGPRVPSVWQSRKVQRLAFVLVAQAGQDVTAQVAKLQSLHNSWTSYFHQLTEGSAWAVTDLQASPDTTPSRIYFPSFRGDGNRYTGFALANWGNRPADVLFRNYGNDGLEIAAPAGILNPRMITIPPGGQIAMLGEQIHGLSLDGPPRDGWIEADAGSSRVSGFFLSGDIGEDFLDGAVADSRTSTRLLFTRAFGNAGSLRNLVEVINPNDTAAHLTFALIDPKGHPGPLVTRTLPPHGRISEEVTALFPGTVPGFSGYVTLSSDLGVIGYESFEAGSTSFALPAQPPTNGTRLYSAQFASGPTVGSINPIRYFTDLNMVNTSTSTRNVSISLIGNDGKPVSVPFNPRILSLAPGEQKLMRGETIFGLQDASVAVGITEGTVVIDVDGEGILGDVTFGDPVALKFMAGLPLAANPGSEMILSQVAEGSQGSGKSYFTGVAMYNPNPADVSVHVEVYSEQGLLTGSQTILLGQGKRVVGTLPQIVPGLTHQMRGYIRISTAGGPIVAFELFGESESVEFLAAVPPQAIFR